jgi:hypothetical protein
MTTPALKKSTTSLKPLLKVAPGAMRKAASKEPAMKFSSVPAPSSEPGITPAVVERLERDVVVDDIRELHRASGAPAGPSRS